MARKMDLVSLTSQPDSYRDADWEGAFFQSLLEGLVKLEKPEPVLAPDGWPYIFVQTGHDATEPAIRVLDWLSERGLGLVVNGQKQVPDYVFSYGMIWHWKERGLFFPAATSTQSNMAAKSEAVEFVKGSQVLVGPPSEGYFPKYVRKIVNQFLLDNGVSNPKVMMLSKDGKSFDLCFSLESLGSPPEEEHQGILEALSWFLPQNYPVMIISESLCPGFQALVE